MSTLFDACVINGVKIANRFVRSATWEGLATEDGACTSKLIALLAQLAEGGVGLIITSHAYVRPDGQATPWQLGIYKDDLIKDLQGLTHAVHERGGRIALQMSHGGILSNPKLTDQVPLAFSQVNGVIQSDCKEMTIQDIEDLIAAFAQAARRTKEAGFDAIQIHAAHGYFLSQSLSPFFNKRRDAYGVSLENRTRLLLKVFRGTRSAVGPDFPILVKINSQDFLNGGLTLEDSIQIVTMIQEAGIDAVELSGGTFLSGKLGFIRGGINSEEKEAYFREEAKAYKQRLRVPLMLVGGIRSFQVAEQLLDEGYADLISMSRPFIREPALVKRWQSGDLEKAKCLSDNKCRGPALAGEGIQCVVEMEQKERD